MVVTLDKGSITKGVVDLNNETTGIIASIGDLILNNPPAALAELRGSEQYPELEGSVAFYPDSQGVLVLTAVTGLPVSEEACGGTVFGMHIHEGESCSGNETDPFADAGAHYNPGECQHPEHAGDMPPLFSNGGSAWNAVLLSKFGVDEVIGKTVIVHGKYDDFETQPSGDSGMRIACGVIVGL